METILGFDDLLGDLVRTVEVRGREVLGPGLSR
jgi:hypothetical protein